MTSKKKPRDYTTSSVIKEEHVAQFWFRICKPGEKMPKPAAKRFIKRWGQAMEISLPADIIQLLDEDVGPDATEVTYEQFKRFIVLIAGKLLIPLDSDLMLSVAPRNQHVMETFKEYLLQPFRSDIHNELLRKLWERLHPNTSFPGIPSNSWLQLGFQDPDPARDFLQCGLCGIECLLALVKHENFFRFLLESAESCDISFVPLCVRVINMTLEFLGWSFDKAKLPRGWLPTTYPTLTKLLFNVGDTVTQEVGMRRAGIAFFKVFFLNLGIVEATWHGVQKDGIQITPQNFDEILAVAATQVEHVLKVMTSTFALDQFLIDHFSLDITFLQETPVFQIWFPGNIYKSVPYKHDTILHEILQKLADARGLQDYVALDQHGTEIPSTYITLKQLGQLMIYYYPQGERPNFDNERKKGWSDEVPPKIAVHVDMQYPTKNMRTSEAAHPTPPPGVRHKVTATPSSEERALSSSALATRKKSEYRRSAGARMSRGAISRTTISYDSQASIVDPAYERSRDREASFSHVGDLRRRNSLGRSMGGIVPSRSPVGMKTTQSLGVIGVTNTGSEDTAASPTSPKVAPSPAIGQEKSGLNTSPSSKDISLIRTDPVLFTPQKLQNLPPIPMNSKTIVDVEEDVRTNYTTIRLTTLTTNGPKREIKIFRPNWYMEDGQSVTLYNPMNIHYLQKAKLKQNPETPRKKPELPSADKFKQAIKMSACRISGTISDPTSIASTSTKPITMSVQDKWMVIVSNVPVRDPNLGNADGSGSDNQTAKKTRHLMSLLPILLPSVLIPTIPSLDSDSTVSTMPSPRAAKPSPWPLMDRRWTVLVSKVPTVGSPPNPPPEHSPLLLPMLPALVPVPAVDNLQDVPTLIFSSLKPRIPEKKVQPVPIVVSTPKLPTIPSGNKVPTLPKEMSSPTINLPPSEKSEKSKLHNSHPTRARAKSKKVTKDSGASEPSPAKDSPTGKNFVLKDVNSSTVLLTLKTHQRQNSSSEPSDAISEIEAEMVKMMAISGASSEDDSSHLTPSLNSTISGGEDSTDGEKISNSSKKSAKSSGSGKSSHKEDSTESGGESRKRQARIIKAKEMSSKSLPAHESSTSPPPKRTTRGSKFRAEKSNTVSSTSFRGNASESEDITSPLPNMSPPKKKAHKRTESHSEGGGTLWEMVNKMVGESSEETPTKIVKPDPLKATNGLGGLGGQGNVGIGVSGLGISGMLGDSNGASELAPGPRDKRERVSRRRKSTKTKSVSISKQNSTADGISFVEEKRDVPELSSPPAKKGVPKTS